MKWSCIVFLVFGLLMLPLGCKYNTQQAIPTTITSSTTTTSSKTETPTVKSTTTTLSKTEANAIAQTKIDAFWTASIFGVCCDMEYLKSDLSRFLTDEQRQMYSAEQWHITCCKTEVEVNAHLHRHIADSLISKPAETFVFADDQNNLYVFVPGRGIDKYRIVVKEFSDANITAVCEMLEMGSTNIVACCYDFTLEKQNNEFVVVARSEAYNY